MKYNDPENVPPVWQVGDVILDRYEVKQVFTGGGMGWSIACITAIGPWTWPLSPQGRSSFKPGNTSRTSSAKRRRG